MGITFVNGDKVLTEENDVDTFLETRRDTS